MATEDQVAVGDRGQCLLQGPAGSPALLPSLGIWFVVYPTKPDGTSSNTIGKPLLCFGYRPALCVVWCIVSFGKIVRTIQAIGQGLLALPAGAVLNAAGAIILGAPVGFQYFTRTLNWSLLMSLFTVVPAASVYGWSWSDWKRIFANCKPSSDVDYTVCLPVHGAIVGAWFGAWPMPLDWERPWQEWPICVTYGAITGYLLGSAASLISILALHRGHHVKAE